MPQMMPQQQGPQKLTWKELEEKMLIDLENTEKRIELLKAQLELISKKVK